MVGVEAELCYGDSSASDSRRIASPITNDGIESEGVLGHGVDFWSHGASGTDRVRGRSRMPGSGQAEGARRVTNQLSSRVSSESAVTLRLREGAIEGSHRNARVGGVELK